MPVLWESKKRSRGPAVRAHSGKSEPIWIYYLIKSVKKINTPPSAHIG